jgi:LPXTG-motif cell wall-anchored protein
VLEIASNLTEGYILSDEQTATVAADELAEMRINNKLIRGEIRIIKTDKATGEPLAGVKFGLFQNGELFAEQTTGADGIASFLNVPYGAYEIKEIATLDGYILSDKVIPVFIREDGEVITIDFENEKVPEIPKTPETPDSPKTGDNSNMALWLTLMGVSIAGLVLTMKRKRKKVSV